MKYLLIYLQLKQEIKLHNKGIYFGDSPSTTIYNVENRNTHSLLKNMVMPLLMNFRKPIIKFRLLGDNRELFESIGVETFEIINDSVNKIDFLIKQNTFRKII